MSTRTPDLPTVSVEGGPDRAHEDMTADCDQSSLSTRPVLHLRQLADEAQWWAAGVANPGDLVRTRVRVHLESFDLPPVPTTGVNDRWLCGAGCGCGVTVRCYTLLIPNEGHHCGSEDARSERGARPSQG